MTSQGLWPVDRSLLQDQGEHISQKIWGGETRKLLKCSEHTRGLVEWQLVAVQEDLLQQWGFTELHKIESFSIDRHLVTALVERWRPETNTFHLPVGEMTITLRDVAFILGLRIDGVKLRTRHDGRYARIIVQDVLGLLPPDNAIKDGKVSMVWLRESFSTLPLHATEDQIRRYTKAYVLYLLGSTIFTDNSGSLVHPHLLECLEGNACPSRYAWGAAALAYLYRSLTKCALGRSIILTGSVTLLQVWAHEHLAIGRPMVQRDVTLHPRALQWSRREYRLDIAQRNNPHHSIIVYRQELDLFREQDVTWEPHDDLELFHIDILLYYYTIARSRVWLIHFDISELHMADRVLRQFGFRQPIPHPPPVMRVSEVRRRRQLWMATTGDQVTEWMEWNEEPQLVPVAEESGHVIMESANLMTQRYQEWYKTVTIERIHPPRDPEPEMYEPRGYGDAHGLLIMREYIDMVGTLKEAVTYLEPAVNAYVGSSDVGETVDVGGARMAFEHLKIASRRYAQRVPHIMQHLGMSTSEREVANDEDVADVGEGNQDEDGAEEQNVQPSAPEATQPSTSQGSRRYRTRSRNVQ